MNSTRELLSIGFAAQTLQRTPGAIVTAASSLGIAPATIINGVSHYSGEQVERIRAVLGAGAVETRGRRK